MRGGRSSLSKYFISASTSLREKLAYGGNFTGSMLTYGLFVYIFSRLWAGVFLNTKDIAGYTQQMMVWYFIMAEVPLFAFGRFFHGLSAEMKSGDIAYMVNRPYGFVSFNFASKIGGSLVEGAVILAEGLVLGFLLIGFPPAGGATFSAGGFLAGGIPADGISVLLANSTKWLLILASLLLSGSINFFFQFSIAMTAFWFEENDAFYWIYQKLTLVVGTLVPVEFLPDAVSKIAWFTPLPYIAYAPARMTVAFSIDEALSLLARQGLWVIAGMLIAKGVFSIGIRRIAVNGG